MDRIGKIRSVRIAGVSRIITELFNRFGGTAIEADRLAP
jgi:hypothetical protein